MVGGIVGRARCHFGKPDLGVEMMRRKPPRQGEQILAGGPAPRAGGLFQHCGVEFSRGDVDNGRHKQAGLAQKGARGMAGVRQTDAYRFGIGPGNEIEMLGIEVARIVEDNWRNYAAVLVRIVMDKANSLCERSPPIFEWHDQRRGGILRRDGDRGFGADRAGEPNGSIAAHARSISHDAVMAFGCRSDCLQGFRKFVVLVPDIRAVDDMDRVNAIFLQHGLAESRPVETGIIRQRTRR